MTDKKDKIAELVALKGVAIEEHEGHASSHNTATGSVQINAQNVTLSNVTFAAGGENTAAANVPKVKTIQEMDDDEREAFQSGEWDGLERRTRDDDTKEYIRALRKRAKRKTDRRTKLLHYTLVMCLFFLLFGSLVMAMLMEKHS